tara:strand:- start:3779 stop:4063 length:285 start_codon:yes stop_codon:yes gene_type:complete
MKNIIIVAFLALLSANALAGNYTTISGDTTNISLEEYKANEKQKSAELKLASAQNSKDFKEQENARKARQKAEKEDAFKAYLANREAKLKANGK